MLSDTLITGLWNTAIGGVVTITLAWINKKAAKKVADKVAVVAKHAEEVAANLKDGDAALAHELVGIRETGEKTHSIVNSERTHLLRFSAILARRVATLNPDNKDDEIVAKAAEALYRKNLDAQPPSARTAGNVFVDQKD